MADVSLDRELLFEALGVHLGFFSRAAVAGSRGRPSVTMAEVSDPRGELGEHLIETGVLSVEHRDVLAKITDEMLERHRGSVDRCFDALSAFGRLRRELEGKRNGHDSTGHPTVDSAAIRNDAGAINPVSTASARDSIDGDSFHPPSNGGADGAGNADDDQWFLGASSAAGGRFHVLRPHAQGGIGKVSVAFDTELQREVALKQIKPERADDHDSRSRFVLEAEVTGRLEHPGIVPVYGLGTDEHGRPYYAMRFVRGTSFDEAIKQFHRPDAGPSRDPRERALALRHLLHRFADVCQTIAYAHSRGVLHRDLKPANVLLGPFNESLVVDWGLAKVMLRAQAEPDDEPDAATATQPAHEGSRSTETAPRSGAKSPASSDSGTPLGFSSSTETAAGTSFGTPAFMSPEQADGRQERLGPASDIYSLGAMLYNLLCGRAPYEFVWCDVTALLDRVRRGDFPPPRRCNPQVPRALEAVCLKAMALKPEDRYGSAADLADEITRWLADEPVAAFREPMPARLARWGRRHKPIVAGLTALLLTAVAALSAGIVLIQIEQTKTERQRVLANIKSTEATEKAEALRRRDAISRVNLAYREYLDDNVALADELLAGCPADLRAWEWDYAHRLGHSELETLPGSSARPSLDVWCVAFSPDGSLLASGTGPWFQVGDKPTGELVVRSVKTSEPVFSLAKLKGAVQSVAFAPDGRRLALAWSYAGSETGAGVAVYDLTKGDKVWEIAERGLNVVSLAFAPDGQTIATGCGFFNDYSTVGYARIRNAATGAEVGAPIVARPGGVVSLAFSPDGQRLALASRAAVDIHDLSSDRRPIIHQLRGHVNFVYAVAYSPDNHFIATAGWDKTIRLWDPASGALAQTLVGHRGFVRGLAFSPDGAQLISGSEDKSVRRWNLAGGDDHAAFHGHTGFVHCVAASPAGALTASGSLDGTVKLWPAAAADSPVTFRNSAGWVGTLAFAPNGQRVASAHYKNIRIWDPRTGEEETRLSGPQDMLGRIGLTFSPDGGTLAIGGPAGSINFWDTTHWSRRQVKDGDSHVINDADFSADGTLLGTIAADGTLRLWDVAAGKVLWSREAHHPEASALAFARDGRRLATTGNDRKARVWDIASGHELAVFNGHETNPTDLAFSPDGAAIASVGGAYHGPHVAEVKIWNSWTGRELASFPGHTSLVHAVAYFPDGKRLATASDDRTVKLWDVATGENVFTLRGHTSGVVSLAISKDGRQVASGSIDYSAKTWSTLAPAAGTDDAAELSLRRAAVERVQFLFARHLLKSDVLEAIRSDRTLSPRFRDAAIEIAEHRAENASGLFEAAWLAIVRPTGHPDDYKLAVRRLEAAGRVVADDPARLDEYRQALALALFRANQPAQALETLATLGSSAQPSPLVLAVEAMASARIGQRDRAQHALDRLAALVETEKWAHNQQALGFWSEARDALRGTATVSP